MQSIGVTNLNEISLPGMYHSVGVAKRKREVRESSAEEIVELTG